MTIEAVGIETLKYIEERIRDPNKLMELRNVLEAILELPQYIAWYAGKVRATEVLQLSKGFYGLDILKDWGLISDNGLLIQPYNHFGSTCISDPACANRCIYPFQEESSKLIRGIHHMGWETWSQITVDPFCGVGNHALGLGGPAFMSDIYPRACAFARINAKLNGFNEAEVVEWDISRGLHPGLKRHSGKRMVFPLNSPFIVGAQINLKDEMNDFTILNSGLLLGRQQMTHYAYLAMDAIARFHLETGTPIRICQIAHSLGNVALNYWEAVEHARLTFGANNVNAELLQGESNKIWRVDGSPIEESPMLVQHMRKKAYDHHQLPDVDDNFREEVAKEYDKLANSFLTENPPCTHIASVMLFITLD